jgi:hypothetical protein
MCTRPLNNWLPFYIEKGFFAYNKPGPDRLISSWFIYGDASNYIIEKWLFETRNYWKSQKIKTTDYWDNYIVLQINYFWFHHLFGLLYENDILFKEIWDSIPKLSAIDPHIVQSFGLTNKLTPDSKKFIDDKLPHLHKLTYRYDESLYNDKCILYYLLSKNILKFMHIPKTGGTSIEDAAFEKNIIWGRFDVNFEKHNSPDISAWHYPKNDGRFYFCVIRCPFDRLISQFYHENEVASYNATNLNIWIEKAIQKFIKDPNYEDNHFLQQIHFAKCCDIKISFDDLNENLNAVLKQYEMRPLSLPTKVGGIFQQQKREGAQFNRLSISDINEKNTDLINKIYSEDIILWNEVKKAKIKYF